MNGRLLLALIACLCVWQGTDMLQADLPLSLGWALLDEAGHAAVALFVLLWTWPTWGWRPALMALLAATAIDIDHAIAARSVEVARLMTLDARPPAHSLLGVLIAANLGAALGGWRLGYAAAVGVLTHIVRDATAPPGVPFLFPVGADWHMLLPGGAVPALMISLAAVGIVWSNWPEWRRSRYVDSWFRHRSPYSGREPRSRVRPASDPPG